MQNNLFSIKIFIWDLEKKQKKKMNKRNSLKKKKRNQVRQDFPGSPVVGSLPASAGDIGSIPGLGRSHMLQGSWGCVPQLLSWHAASTEACLPRARALQQEKPPFATTTERPHSTEDSGKPKINID